MPDEPSDGILPLHRGKVEVPVAREFRFDPSQRLVVLTARLPLAIEDHHIAVPFALLSVLAAQVASNDGRAELQKLGMKLPGQTAGH